MRNFVDVFGRPAVFDPSFICVTATDKFLSGWGCAAGKIHKQVIVCPDYETAQKAAYNMQGNGYKYINIRRRGSFPTFNGSRYSVSYRFSSDCPALLY